MKNFESANDRYSEKLQRVRETLGLNSRDESQNSPLKGSNSRNFENTFGKSQMMQEIIQNQQSSNVVRNRFYTIAEQNIAKNESKQNMCRKNDRLISKLDGAQKNQIDSIEMNVLRNELNKYKHRELQLRVEIQKLQQQVQRLDNQNKSILRKLEAKYDHQSSGLQSELREAKFIVQMLKNQADKYTYFHFNKDSSATKIYELQEKVATLLFEKFKAEQKLEEASKHHHQDYSPVDSQSRIQNMKIGLQYWMNKSKRIEAEAYQIIEGLRNEIAAFKSELLQENIKMHNSLKQNVKKFKNSHKIEHLKMLENLKCLQQKQKLFHSKVAELRVKKKSFDTRSINKSKSKPK